MNKTMAATHPIISPEDQFDLLVNDFLTKVLSAFYSITRIGLKYIGILGFTIIAIPLAITIIPILYFLLRRKNSQVRKQLQPVYNWINDANESDLRHLHLDVERRNKLFRNILSKKRIVDRNIITMGISSQTTILINQFFNLEDALKNAAYPNYDKSLSESDVDELLSIFEGAERD